jgi:hypothetical protein
MRLRTRRAYVPPSPWPSRQLLHRSWLLPANPPPVFPQPPIRLGQPSSPAHDPSIRAQSALHAGHERQLGRLRYLSAIWPVQMNAFNPAERLRQHAHGLVGKPLSAAELIEVMRLLRLVLEREKLRDSFPHVALYCDWLLHNEIDRHEIAIEILCQMHVAIVDWDRTHELAPVSRALSLAQLRS